MKAILALMALVLVFSYSGACTSSRRLGEHHAHGRGRFHRRRRSLRIFSWSTCAHSDDTVSNVRGLRFKQRLRPFPAHLPPRQSCRGAKGQNLYLPPARNLVVEVAQAYKNAKGPSPEHVIVQDRRGNLVEDSK